MKVRLFCLFLYYRWRLLIYLDFLDIGDVLCLVVNIEVLLLAISGQFLLLQRPFSLPFRRFIGTNGSSVRVELIVVLFGLVVESDRDLCLWFFNGIRLRLNFSLLLVRLPLPISHSKVELRFLLLCLDSSWFFFRHFQSIFGL